jgi:N-acetylmuramoyl-L-alanine amidase
MMKVCIDPGHGGYDPGAVGPSGLKEKDVTLSVSTILSKILQSKGIDVVLTRTGDLLTWRPDNDLWARCNVANQAKADIFVSIHCNSATNPAATGTETFCYQKSGQAYALAQAIQSCLVQTLRLPDRGVKTANFYVLRGTNMPAVLVELAFINNPKEEALLRNGDFQRTCAESIAQGILQVMGVDEVLPGAKIKVDDKILQGFIKNDLTYAPVRALAEALGYKVAWDDKTRTVTITKEAK